MEASIKESGLDCLLPALAAIFRGREGHGYVSYKYR